MKKIKRAGRLRSRAMLLGAILAPAILLWIAGTHYLSGQPSVIESRQPTSDIFTPAHSSMSEAVGHFFGIRPEKPQPIAFVHKVHLEGAELACLDCHVTAERGPVATIPDIRTCWSCHQNTLTDHPEIMKIKGYHDRGEDIPWERVYGWNDEAYVRFNHAPHIRAEVDCATCHGNVAEMDIARREVQHTMGFCVGCHQERKVSNDCQTCHY